MQLQLQVRHLFLHPPQHLLMYLTKSLVCFFWKSVQPIEALAGRQLALAMVPGRPYSSFSLPLAFNPLVGTDM